MDWTWVGGGKTGKSQDTGVEMTYCSAGFNLRERGRGEKKNQGSPSGFSTLNN